jgi:AcrR family transcriptional regulator
MTSTPTLRERKKAATREALQAAALRLAVRDGLDALTVEAIAEAVDVSPRTFFNYFGSKEEALLPSDEARHVELQQAIAARPADEPPIEALHAVVRTLAVRISERREETTLRMQLVRENPSLLPRHLANFATFERVLVEAIAGRTGLDPDCDLYPSLAATAAVGALRSASQLWRNQGGKAQPDLVDLVDDAFRELAAGLPALSSHHPSGSHDSPSSPHPSSSTLAIPLPSETSA